MSEQIAVQRKHRVLRVFTTSRASAFYQAQGYQILRRPFNFWLHATAYIPCQWMEKQLLPVNPILKWVGRHPVIILLLLSLWLAINTHYYQKQNTQSPEKQNIRPQFNLPAHDIRSQPMHS